MNTAIRQDLANTIAEAAKCRIFLDGRYDDDIPGMPRKRYYTRDYVGPERRKVVGTLFDRRGYLRNAHYDPESRERSRTERSDRRNSNDGSS